MDDFCVGVVRHLHLGEGAGDAAEAVVVVVVGEGVGRPVVTCGSGCRAAVEARFVGLGEMRFKFIPTLVEIVESVPFHHGCDKKACLFNVDQPLVEDLHRRVGDAGSHGLDEEFLQVEEHRLDWLRGVPRIVPRLGSALLL